ncbi:hypothetical protein MTO96_035054 [Rhipicephalus appendiculatus]
MELASHTCHLYIVLLLIPLIFALPPGFDSQVLPYFASGYRSLTLGAVCASTSQCPQGTCCLNSRPGGPVCRPAAVMGGGCHPVRYLNMYFRFCPCARGARCHPRTRRCIPP